MSAIALILDALAQGAAGVASGAVGDAYQGLKALVKRRFEARPEPQQAEMVLAGYEQAPETWQKPLEAELGAVNAAEDEELLAAARKVLGLVNAEGKNVNYGKIQGVQGDRASVGEMNFFRPEK